MNNSKNLIVKNPKNKILLFFAFSFLLSLCREASEFLYQKDAHVDFSRLEVLLTLFLGFLGYWLVFFILLFLLDYVFFDIPFSLSDPQKISSPVWLYLILAIGWLPVLLIKYPGAMNYDSWRMLWEYRSGNMTQHHSVFYSVLLGFFVNTLEKIGNANLGLFLFCVLHYLVYVFVFGYSLAVLQKRFHANKLLLTTLIISYLLNPYVSGYIGVALKDNFYSVWVFLLIICLTELASFPAEFTNTKGKLFLLLLTGLNVWLLRKNGPYIMICVLLVCLVLALFQERAYKKAVTILAFTCVLSFGISSLLVKAYDAKPGSISEALSLPFQQTARYGKYYGDDVTEQERTVLNQILDYDTAVSVYTPRISDSVKSNYLENDTALPAYFKVWLAQFLRHPQVYFEATLEQNWYLFLPEIENITLFRDFDVAYEAGMEVIMSDTTVGYYEPIFSVPDVLKAPQEMLIKLFMVLHRAPLLKYLGSTAVFTYLLFMVIAIFWARRIKWFLPLLPALISFVFVILGPAIYAHPRYMFPVVYSLPFVIIYGVMAAHRQPDSRTDH